MLGGGGGGGGGGGEPDLLNAEEVFNGDLPLTSLTLASDGRLWRGRIYTYWSARVTQLSLLGSVLQVTIRRSVTQ